MVLVSCRPASCALFSKVELNDCSIVPLKNLRRSTKTCPAGQLIKLFKHGIKISQGKQHGRRDLRTMANSSSMPAMKVAVTCAATGTGSRHVENSEDLASPFSHCAIKNGQLLQEYPGTAAELLRAHPQGAYTTTRTAREWGLVCFWDRHLARLADSMQRIDSLASDLPWDENHFVSGLKTWMKPSLDLAAEKLRLWMVAHPHPAEQWSVADVTPSVAELAITLLVCRERDEPAESALDVFVHISTFQTLPLHLSILPIPAHLAIMGPGRRNPLAKAASWAMRSRCDTCQGDHHLWTVLISGDAGNGNGRTRQHLEFCRPAHTSEVVLSNDGDALLEGCVTNLFIVRRVCGSVETTGGARSELEIQTCPLDDGVLPGVIRQVVIEVCEASGLPLCQVAPRWAERDSWQEAFVTSSLRFVQPVASVSRPATWREGSERDPWTTNESWRRWEVKEGGMTGVIREQALQKVRALHPFVAL